MAKYLLSEPAYIHGVYYAAGTTAEFSNDLPPAISWIPLDDDAKFKVEQQNKVRAKRGLKLSELPTVPDLIRKLEEAGYAVSDPDLGEATITNVDETGGNEALVLGGGGAVKARINKS